MMEQDKKEMVITGESLLSDIRDQFSRFYPFLAIEFFQAEQAVSLAHTAAKLAPGTRIKAFADIQTAHTIDFNSQRTVSEVVRDVTSLLAVKVHVCRKSGNVWNAISLTEGWTLERQNAAGEYISGIMTTPPAAL